MSTDHDAGHPPFRILSMAELLDLGPHVPTEPALIEIEPGENLNRPTWTALVRHEPDLAALLTEIVAVRADGSRFCANDIWYGAFKLRLVRMVGMALCGMIHSSVRQRRMTWRTSVSTRRFPTAATASVCRSGG